MKYSSFHHYLIVREGALVPDKAPATGLPRLNATALTNAERKRLKPKPVVKLAPVWPLIPQVVPNHLIPKNLDPSGTSLLARQQSLGG